MMMQVQKKLKMEQMLKASIPAVLNLKMLLLATEGQSLVVQNAAGIDGYLEGAGAEAGAGVGVACSNDKEGIVDNVAAHTHMADKIAVDIVHVVVVGALRDMDIDVPAGVVSPNRV